MLDPRAAMLEAEAAVVAADRETDAVPPGGVISVSARLADGREMVGEFTFMLPLSVNDQNRIGQISARLRGGMPVAAFAGDKAELLEMVAFLQVALRGAPGWAMDSTGAVNLGEMPTFIVGHIYREVEAHAGRFRDACQLRGPGQG